MPSKSWSRRVCETVLHHFIKMKQKNEIKEKLKHLKKPLLIKIAKKVGLDDYNKLTSQQLVTQLSQTITNEVWEEFMLVRQRRKRIKILTVVTLTAALLGIYSNGPKFVLDTFEKMFSADYIFTKRVQKLDLEAYDVSVLVLPFEQYSENGDDVGKVLTKRLNNLGLEDSLKLLAYYHDEFNSHNINSNNEAKNFLGKTKFDIVVFGDQLTNNCSEGVNEVCIKYIVNTNFDDYLDRNKESLAQKFHPYSLRGLFEGDLQGRIDLVINKILLLVYKNNGNLNKSLERAEIIVDSLGGNDQASFFDLIIQRLYHQQYQLALDEINEYSLKILDNTIEDILYIHSLKVMVYSRFSVDDLINQIDENDIVFKLFESQIPKTESVARSYHRIGEFTSSHFPKYSIPFLETAIKLFDDFGLPDDKNECMHNLGIANYYNGQYEAAINYLSQALSEYDKNKKFDRWLIVNAEFHLGLAYLKSSNKREANRKFKKVINYTKNANVSTELFKYLIIIIDEYIGIEEPKEGIFWLKKLGKISFNDLHDQKYVKYVIAERNSKISILKGDREDAFEYFSQTQEIWNDFLKVNEQECEINKDLLLIWKEIAEQYNPIWTFRVNEFFNKHRIKCF